MSEPAQKVGRLFAIGVLADLAVFFEPLMKKGANKFEVKLVRHGRFLSVKNPGAAGRAVPGR
jgi:hypothetical protein